MATRLLLADDEEGIRKVLGISLADSGYDVVTAENGDKALELFRELRPQIVLTDIKMPGMDGIELLQTIKQENPDTEVIMITGHGDMDLAIKSLKYAATDFVTKPINDDVLEIALKRAHERISMRRQLKEYTENLEQLVKEQSARLVEVERLAAIGQTVEGLSSALRNIADDLDGGIRYFNEMPCFVAIHNRDLKVVATNQLYMDRLGNKVGHNSWEIYADAHNTADSCPVAQTFKTGIGRRSQESIRYRDGRTYTVMVHTAPIRDSRDEVELVLEITADISEMERLREELRTSQQRYQQLFDEVPCCISVQERDLRITASNRRFKEDFGEALGAPCYEVYRQQQFPCTDCAVIKTFADGRPHQAEMVVTSRDGNRMNMLIGTAPIINASGEIVQVMEMSTDITQIRQLQENLATLGLMVGSISHGIKGVLTGLDAGLYFLTTGLSKNNESQIEEGLEVVKLMVERIRSVVLDILYYAKDRPLDWKPMDARQFAEEVIAVVEPKIRRHPIELLNDFESDLGNFEVDSRVACTALSNIFENAVEACLEDRSGRTHRIVFRVLRDGNLLAFEVIDNGVGMDSETCTNLFDLFFSTKGKKGTGLGLFIADRIVKQHGGRIDVASTLGKGTRFRVLLPRQLPQSVKSPV